MRTSEEREPEPLESAVGGIGKGAGHAVDDLHDRRLPAGRPIDGDAHQRDADHEDDRAGDDGRKQRQQAADERRDDHTEYAAGDHGAIDAEHADVGVGRHRQHWPDGREGHAHHHGHADADKGQAVALDEAGEAASEEIRADQEGNVLRRQLQRAADDERHRDGAGVHDEDVLQTERQ